IMQDGFYTGGDINSLFPIITANEMYSLKKNDRLIGAGFIGVSKRTPGYADIAMIIDKENRHNGYGVLIVKVLVAKCRLLNLIPTAVCDVTNLASRKVLQKAGFHLDGCLLLAQVDIFNTN
ncbi:MAG: GNAT family N-acetyltransferase, partial [Oscillospiraceae bacterium]|nr:GNAT family N-acetyltransferase [Oscillospiraceae bacterium]